MTSVGGKRICLLLMAVMLTACSCARQSTGQSSAAAEAGPDEVPVKITAVGFDESTQAHFVLLTSTDQEHELPILIGDGEADAIMRALHGIKPERPLTQDLLKSVVEKSGSKVDCVSICDVRDKVYYATIYMNSGQSKIDSRPSDAIALAASLGAPIYVASRLFEDEPRPGVAARHAPHVATAMGITVEELTPPLAAYFHAPKGVLVAEVGESAAKDGLERGDVITRVGMQEVNAPAEFRARIEAIKDQRPVVLRLNHDGSERSITLAVER
ncbi:MAG: bifunctional nuclease domain-containing protein [Candidatus Binataceae bacterium]